MLKSIVHNCFWGWESVLDDTECDYIIKTLKDTKWKPASITEKAVVDKGYRATDVAWRDMMSPLGCTLQAYINAANHYAGWRFDLNYMEKVQLGKYSDEENSFYDWHIDTGRPDNNEEQRKLSISLLLSDPKDFEGGRLEFKGLSKEENNKILPKRGSIIVFPSFLEHRVTPVTKGVRYSAVSWMNGAKFR